MSMATSLAPDGSSMRETSVSVLPSITERPYDVETYTLWSLGST